MNLYAAKKYLEVVAENPNFYMRRTQSGRCKFDWAKIIFLDEKLNESDAKTLAALCRVLHERKELAKYKAEDKK